MLQSISWLQFGSFIFILLVSYYGYVLYRFCGREVLGLVAPCKDEKEVITGEQAETVDEKRRVAEGEVWKGNSGRYGAATVELSQAWWGTYCRRNSKTK